MHDIHVAMNQTYLPVTRYAGKYQMTAGRMKLVISRELRKSRGMKSAFQ